MNYIMNEKNKDFDPEIYRLLNKDLKNLSKNELFEHYIKNCKKEKRKYKLDLPYNFDVNMYKILNKDLKYFSDTEAKIHYLNHGKSEKRPYEIKIPDDFDAEIYKLLHEDIINLSNDEAKIHYYLNGIKENRIYQIILPDDFDINIYKLLNDDLINKTSNELKIHYLKYGKNEKRNYKIVLPLDFDCNIYKKNSDELTNMSDIELKVHYIKFGSKLNYNYYNPIYKIIKRNKNIFNNILISSYFVIKDINLDEKYIVKRQHELNNCLIKNVKNNYISEVHLFVNKIHDFLFIPFEFMSKIKQIKIETELSFSDIFEYYNKNLSNKICILIKPDNFVDNSIELLTYVNFDENVVFALNRYEENTDNIPSLLNGTEFDEAGYLHNNKICSFEPSIWIQDAWIWNTDYINHFEEVKNVLFNSEFADIQIANFFFKNKYVIMNPSKLICINHLNMQNIKYNNYGIIKSNIDKYKDIIVNNIDHIFLDNVDDIPDKYTIFIKNIVKKPDTNFVQSVKIDKNINILNIDNTQIFSSSYNFIYYPYKAKFTEDDYWEPHILDENPFIEFNFKQLCKILVIDLRGKDINIQHKTFGYMNKFKISYYFNKKWNNLNKIFEGINIKNGNYIKRIYFDEEIECERIKILPIIFKGVRICKIQFYGKYSNITKNYENNILYNNILTKEMTISSNNDTINNYITNSNTINSDTINSDTTDSYTTDSYTTDSYTTDSYTINSNTINNNTINNNTINNNTINNNTINRESNNNSINRESNNNSINRESNNNSINEDIICNDEINNYNINN